MFNIEDFDYMLAKGTPTGEPITIAFVCEAGKGLISFKSSFTIDEIGKFAMNNEKTESHKIIGAFLVSQFDKIAITGDKVILIKHENNGIGANLAMFEKTIVEDFLGENYSYSLEKKVESLKDVRIDDIKITRVVVDNKVVYDNPHGDIKTDKFIEATKPSLADISAKDDCAKDELTDIPAKNDELTPEIKDLRETCSQLNESYSKLESELKFMTEENIQLKKNLIELNRQHNVQLDHKDNHIKLAEDYGERLEAGLEVEKTARVKCENDLIAANTEIEELKKKHEENVLKGYFVSKKLNEGELFEFILDNTEKQEELVKFMFGRRLVHHNYKYSIEKINRYKNNILIDIFVKDIKGGHLLDDLSEGSRLKLFIDYLQETKADNSLKIQQLIKDLLNTDIDNKWKIIKHLVKFV